MNACPYFHRQVKLTIELLQGDIDNTAYQKQQQALASTARKSMDLPTLAYLEHAFALNQLESFYFMLCLLPALDAQYAIYIAQQQNGNTAPAAALAVKLFYGISDLLDLSDGIQQTHILQERFTLLCCTQQGVLDPSLIHFVLTDGDFGQNLRYAWPQDMQQPLPAMDDFAQSMVRAARFCPSDKTVCLAVYGGEGLGKHTQCKRAAAILQLPLVLVSLKKEDDKQLLCACRQALLLGGAIALQGLDEVDIPRAIQTASRFCGIIFCITTIRIPTIYEPELCFLSRELTPPDSKQSIALWRAALSKLRLAEPLDPAEMANKFTFTPAQIMAAAQDAAGQCLWSTEGLTRAAIHESAKRQISHCLSAQATLLRAQYTWQDLILAQPEKQMLRAAVNQILYRHIVYMEWGFDKRVAYGCGVSLLFAGPPGTGKTMAAQAVANALGLMLYKVDLSCIVSKYVGETEKNLDKLFAEATRGNAILLFDETDAILGKRTEIRDANDRNANLEISFLLQRMEEYSGVTIMTTNYLENIDPAFFRRISFVIHFPMPDEKTRLALWRGMFPDAAPLDKEIDFDYLARQFQITGGSIKNAAVAAAFTAAEEGRAITMPDILRALRYELTKQGKIMLNEDFGEYAQAL